MAALVHHLEECPARFGSEGLTLRRLLTGMRSKLPIGPDAASTDRLGRALDSFVEAQIHGVVDLQRDVCSADTFAGQRKDRRGDSKGD